MMNEVATTPTLPPLSEDEKARLRLWAQATPAQRLSWLEESMKIAAAAKQRHPATPSRRD